MQPLVHVMLRHGALINMLLEDGATTRSALSEITGVKQPTVTRWINELAEAGLVQEIGLEQGRPSVGRRRVLVDLNPQGAYVISLHITKTYIESGLINLRGEVVFSNTVEPPKLPSSNAYSEPLIKQTLSDLLEQVNKAKIPTERLLGVGVAASGGVDTDADSVFIYEGKDGKKERVYIPLRRMLTEIIALPVEMETNAWAIAMGERWYGSQELNFLLIHADEGVGAAMVTEGCLHRGKGQAGEIGCVKVGHDQVCQFCGEKGCLADVISRGAVIRAANALGSFSSVEKVLTAAESDPLVEQVVAHAAEAVAMAAAPMVDLIDPEALILSGPLFRTPKVPEYVKERLAQNSFAGRNGLRVFPTRLGSHAALVGAASLVYSKAFGNEIKLRAGKGWAHAVSQLTPWGSAKA